jgi:hypothetical protein
LQTYASTPKPSLPQKARSILSDTELLGVALNSKSLGERKNANLPGVLVDLPVLGPKDVDDVQNFACRWGGQGTATAVRAPWFVLPAPAASPLRQSPPQLTATPKPPAGTKPQARHGPDCRELCPERQRRALRSQDAGRGWRPG